MAGVPWFNVDDGEGTGKMLQSGAMASGGNGSEVGDRSGPVCWFLLRFFFDGRITQYPPRSPAPGATPVSPESTLFRCV